MSALVSVCECVCTFSDPASHKMVQLILSQGDKLMSDAAIRTYSSP